MFLLSRFDFFFLDYEGLLDKGFFPAMQWRAFWAIELVIAGVHQCEGVLVEVVLDM